MSSYDEEVIAEFRTRGGSVAGRLGGLSILLLHHVGAKIRRGARNATRVLAHRERRRRRARVKLRSSSTPRLVPQPRGASHDHRRDRCRHLDRTGPCRAAGRAPATHRRDRREDTVGRGDGQNHPRPIPVVILDLLERTP